MRRNDKEITGADKLEEILNKAQICRIAICRNSVPYIVPMNFGYKSGILYFHSANEGKKIEILRENPLASFEVETDIELVTSEKACNWGMKFQSVIGQGNVIFVEDQNEKAEALGVIMEKYAGKQKFEFPEASLKAVSVFKIKIEEMTGKKSG